MKRKDCKIMNKSKKIIALIAALNLVFTTFALPTFADTTETTADTSVTEPMTPPDGVEPPNGITPPDGSDMKMPPDSQCGMQNKEKSDYFTDVDSNYSWAAAQIDYLYENNIVNGTSDGEYSPAATIKRGDFVLMLHRKCNFTADISDCFSDVSTDKYYYEAIAKAKASGIFLETDTFSPEDAITRQDAMYMIYNALKANGDIKDEDITTDVSQYADSASIADYAKEAVATLSKKGIIQGSDGNFNPANTMTRAEMAVVFYNISNMNGQSAPNGSQPPMGQNPNDANMPQGEKPADMPEIPNGGPSDLSTGSQAVTE